SEFNQLLGRVGRCRELFYGPFQALETALIGLQGIYNSLLGQRSTPSPLSWEVASLPVEPWRAVGVTVADDTAASGVLGHLGQQEGLQVIETGEGGHIIRMSDGTEAPLAFRQGIDLTEMQWTDLETWNREIEPASTRFGGADRIRSYDSQTLG